MDLRIPFQRTHRVNRPPAAGKPVTLLGQETLCGRKNQQQNFKLQLLPASNDSKCNFYCHLVKVPYFPSNWRTQNQSNRMNGVENSLPAR